MQINADEIVNLERQLDDLGQVAFLRNAPACGVHRSGTLIIAERS
jgi:hypothetical protein